jgi:hypothetical protein
MNSSAAAAFPRVATALVALAALAGCAQPHVHAPSGSYAGQQSRDIKALSEEEVQGYLAGAGMGFARAAELLGAEVVRLERELDALFATALMTPVQVERYAQLRGY